MPGVSALPAQLRAWGCPHLHQAQGSSHPPHCLPGPIRYPFSSESACYSPSTLGIARVGTLTPVSRTQYHLMHLLTLGACMLSLMSPPSCMSCWSYTWFYLLFWLLLNLSSTVGLFSITSCSTVHDEGWAWRVAVWQAELRFILQVVVV